MRLVEVVAKGLDDLGILLSQLQQLQARQELYTKGIIIVVLCCQVQTLHHNIRSSMCHSMPFPCYLPLADCVKFS